MNTGKKIIFKLILLIAFYSILLSPFNSCKLKTTPQIKHEEPERKDSFHQQPSEKRSLLQQAADSYTQRDFKKAAEFFEEILEDTARKSNDSQLNFNKGLHFYNNSDYYKSIIFFQNCLYINPFHKKAKKYLDDSIKKADITIKIKDSPTEAGPPIKELIIYTNKLVTLYAVAYDKKNIFIGPIDVFWKQKGTLEPIRIISPLVPINEKITKLAVKKEITIKKSHIIQLKPSTPGTQSIITAYLDKYKKYETVKIIVKPDK